jgi:hypothetical protein
MTGCRLGDRTDAKGLLLADHCQDQKSTMPSEPRGTRRNSSERGEQMAVSCTPASADSGPAVSSPVRATIRPPYPLVLGSFIDQASWTRVIRYAQCGQRVLTPISGSRSARTPTGLATRRLLPSRSARPARYAVSVWSCRCGIGISASTVSGVAWSQPNARHCAAHHLRTNPHGSLPDRRAGEMR